MKPLEETFNKNGFTYELHCRQGPYAIYKQRLRPGVGCLAYEVFIIRVRKGGVEVQIGNGKPFTPPDMEYGPSNEDFGTFGWTYPTLDRAEAKYKELLAKPTEKP